MQPLLEELYPELFPPKFVSEELQAAGGVTAGLLAAYKLLRIVPLSVSTVMVYNLQNGCRLSVTPLGARWLNRDGLCIKCVAGLMRMASFSKG